MLGGATKLISDASSSPKTLSFTEKGLELLCNALPTSLRPAVSGEGSPKSDLLPRKVARVGCPLYSLRMF
jgi:hypothetical protein